MWFSLVLHWLVRCCRSLPWRHHACATASSTSKHFTNENSLTQSNGLINGCIGHTGSAFLTLSNRTRIRGGE